MEAMTRVASKPEINPYAPPQHDSAARWPILPPELWPALNLTVVSVSGESLIRRIHVLGSIDATIHYDGWTPPTEVVYVNGVACGRGNVWDTTWISPAIEFTVDGDGFRLPARIDAQAGLSLFTFLRLTHFRLTIAGRVVHEEPKAGPHSLWARRADKLS
jgi:hypothetical protein